MSLMSDSDWRLRGPMTYLVRLTLRRRRWTQTRQNWDHDHCEFCSAKFAESGDASALHEGWSTPDEYRWICDRCFNDFRTRFGWIVKAE